MRDIPMFWPIDTNMLIISWRVSYANFSMIHQQTYAVLNFILTTCERLIVDELLIYEQPAWCTYALMMSTLANLRFHVMFALTRAYL